MSNTIPTNVTQSRLAQQAERPQRAVSSTTSPVFQSQLVSAMQGSRRAVAGAGAFVGGRQMIAVTAAARQNSASASSGRLRDDPVRTQVTSTPAPVTPVPLNPFTAAAAAAAKPAPAAAPVTTPVTVPTTPAAEPTQLALSMTPPAVAMEVLNAALRKSGIEPTSLNLFYEESVVGYPGGSYTNRYITCALPGGITESYDIGLMMKNPWLTAYEINARWATGRKPSGLAAPPAPPPGILWGDETTPRNSDRAEPGPAVPRPD